MLLAFYGSVMRTFIKSASSLKWTIVLVVFVLMAAPTGWVIYAANPTNTEGGTYSYMADLLVPVMAAVYFITQALNAIFGLKVHVPMNHHLSHEGHSDEAPAVKM